jgi:uridine kinase
MSSDESTYRATLRFLISAAAQKAFDPSQNGQKALVGGRNVGGALLYSFDDGSSFDDKDVSKLESVLGFLLKADHEILAETTPYDEALKIFEHKHLKRTVSLLKSRVTDTVMVHSVPLSGMACLGLMGQELLPRTSNVTMPPLIAVDGHLLVSLGDGDEEPKAKRSRSDKGGATPNFSTSLVKATKDLSAWDKVLGVDGLGDLNQLATSGRELHDFILHAEFRQEATIASLASSIAARVNDGSTNGAPRVGVVCIAGPTSSGKTTFATKLTMYLRNLGLTGVALTADHYYLPLDRQPKYQPRKNRADVDYDALESMDADLLNSHINALLEGKEVMTPVYNMKSGYRDGDGHPFKLPSPVDKSLLVIEGIHALNPDFLHSVDPKKVFKVYISPLSSLQLDEGVPIKTTDARLLRRMCRDYNFRGASASRTLSMWANVRRGEGRWIFPFQDAVDFVVNSAHEYELRILKPMVEPLLTAVPPTDPHYAKARSLLEMLALINPAPTTYVPTTSLLREFIGNGDFDCH